MPFIRVELAGSFSKEQKSAVVTDLTRSMVERLGRPAAAVQIVIAEHATENYGANGILIADRAAAPAREVANANGGQ
jgi:4-oxalocrotonate tautomerase